MSARSDDGVAEAIEWDKPECRPFLLMVQWHPERMGQGMFSSALMERFVREQAHRVS